jgi:hypothetical protein
MEKIRSFLLFSFLLLFCAKDFVTRAAFGTFRVRSFTGEVLRRKTSPVQSQKPLPFSSFIVMAVLKTRIVYKFER